MINLHVQYDALSHSARVVGRCASLMLLCIFAVSAVPAASSDLLTPESASFTEWQTAAHAAFAPYRDPSGLRVEGVKSRADGLDAAVRATANPANLTSYYLTFVVPSTGQTTAALTVLATRERQQTYRSETQAPPSNDVPLEVYDLGWVRNVRLASVRVPAAPLADPSRLLVQGTVRVNFTEAPAAKPAGNDAEATRGTLGEMLSRFVENPADLGRFAAHNDKAPRQWDPAPHRTLGVVSPFRFCMDVETTGLYRVTASDFSRAGVDPSKLNPQSLRLLLGGQPQSLRLQLASPNAKTFGPEDSVVFFGVPNNSPFTKTNAYWLVANDSLQVLAEAPLNASPAAEPASIFPRTLLFDEDNILQTRNDQFLSILEYRWVWQRLENGTTFTKAFDLPGLADFETMVRVKLRLYSHSFDERLPIVLHASVNGSSPTEHLLMRLQDDTVEFAVPRMKLRERGNTLDLRLQLTKGDAAKSDTFLDSIAVTYPSRYVADAPMEFVSPGLDMTTTSTARGLANVRYEIEQSFTAAPLVVDISGTTPRFVEIQLQPGVRTTDPPTVRFDAMEKQLARYVITGLEAASTVSLRLVTADNDLRDNSRTADTVIIAAPEFVQSMTTYAEVLRSAGHDVEIVSVRDIFDQFSDGIPTPDGLRNFLGYATANWKGNTRHAACTNVLFVGDATSAARDEFREFRRGVRNYVPTRTVTSAAGERWASELWFASLYGNDSLADCLIGRISVNNVADLTTILDKQVEYRSLPNNQSWCGRAAFVADHSDFDDAVNRSLSYHVPVSPRPLTMFLSKMPWVDNYYFPKEVAEEKKAKVSPDATGRIRDMFESGVAYMMYFGHGSPNIWSSERIWFGGDTDNSDNLQLRNRPRLPVVINMTCNSGAFDYPIPKWNVSISEDMMRVAQGGSVANIVPTGPGTTSLHERLAAELFRTFYRDEITTLGAAMQLSHWRYLARQQPAELPKMFVLLGDPTLPFHLNTQANQTGHGFHADSAPLQFGGWQPDAAPQRAEAGTAKVARITNPASEPRRSAQVVLRQNGRDILKSMPVDLLPYETRETTVTIPIKKRTQRFGVALQYAASSGPVMRSLRRDEDLTVLPAAESKAVRLELLTESLRWEAQQLPSGVLITVYGDLHNLGEAVSGVNFAVEAPVGTDAQNQPRTPAIPARSTHAFALRINVPRLDDSLPARILVDPTGELGMGRPALDVRVDLGRKSLADIAIAADSVRVNPPTATDGHTIFAMMAVVNRGQQPVSGVRLEGYVGETTTSPRMESRVPMDNQIAYLDAGESRTLELRWDTFRNAGTPKLLFDAATVSGVIESDPTNNTAKAIVHLLTKHRLFRADLRVIPPTPEDIAKRQLRVVATVGNAGESAARGVRVVIYPGEHYGNLRQAVGESIISEIPAKSQASVEMAYRLRPGDEKKQAFPFAFDAFLKGSSQRLPPPSSPARAAE